MKTPARKAPAKKTPATRAPARTAAQNAAPAVDSVTEPAAADTAQKPPAKKPTAAAARAAAAKNSAARTPAAPRTAAKGSARTAAAKSGAAPRTTAKTAASKTAAAKTAAERAAAAKTTERTAAAKRNTVKTTAAVTAAKTAAAKKAAAAKAAEEAAAAKAAEEAAAAEDVESAPAAEEAAPAAEAAETIETALPTGAAEGAIGEEPVAEEPAAAQPAAVEPAAAEPAAVKPVAAEPLAEETATGEPDADGSVVVEAPVVDAPVSDAPSDADGSPAEADVAVPDAAVEPAAETSVPAAGGEAAIRIRGLVKTFGDHTAVNGIDLTVPAGSFYGIVGPNGAGKTTTLSIIAGLLRSDAGEVVISGVDQSTQPLAAKRILGVLPDRLRTFDRLTGRQLLYYYGLLRGLAASVIEKRVADLARAFDLGDALGRVVSDYSAGMTKKIMLAGAMIHSPRVLVLDEPFEAVDPVSSAVILDILRAYVAHGGTVILSSHGMDLVERVCSRVAIIVSGDVLAEGTIDEVRAGQTLESRFVELAGSSAEVEGLEWLHTFSD